MSIESENAVLDGSSPPPFKGRRAALAFVWVNVFLSVLGYGIIGPILPRLVLSLLHGDMSHAAEIVGLIGTVFGLMHFLFGVVQGAMSDRLGRRPVLVYSNIGLGLDYIVMALAPTVGWLFVGRIISGATAASVMTSFAYVTDITPPEKRTRIYGILGMAGGLGGMAGPALGGFLGGIDIRLPFWVAAGLSLANGLYGLLIIPESLHAKHRTKLSWQRLNPLGALTVLRKAGPLRRILISNLFVQFATAVMPTVFVLYTAWRYHWNAHDAGFALGALGLGGLVIQGWLLGIISKQLGDWRMLLVGLACNAAGLLILGLAPSGLFFWIGFPLIALGGLAGPASLSLMTGLVKPSDQGHMLGSLSSAVEIAGLVAPSAFAGVFAASIGTYLDWDLPGAAFLLAALCLVAAIVPMGLRFPHRASPEL